MLLVFLGLLVLESDWLNYPGFEAWRFVNLFIFIAAALYLHRRFGAPVREALRTRRGRIKLELENAKRERERAAAELQEVESRLSELSGKVAKIRKDAEAEVVAERERIKQATESEMAKLRAQGQRDVANMIKNAHLEVRKFAAAHNIKLAEALIRRQMDPNDDARLIALRAEEYGGRQN